MYFTNNVNYGAIWQPILVALVLLAVGVPMEYRWLRKGNLWSSVFLDFVSAFIIIWGLSSVFNGASVTFAGALMTSAVIGVCEYFLHRYLLGSKKAKKSPA